MSGTTSIVESHNTTTTTPATVTYKSVTADTGFHVLLIGGSILLVLVLVGSLWRVGFDGGKKKNRVKPRHAHVYVATKKHSPLIIVHKEIQSTKQLPDVPEETDDVDGREDNVAPKANGNEHTLANASGNKHTLANASGNEHTLANASGNGHTLANASGNEHTLANASGNGHMLANDKLTLGHINNSSICKRNNFSKEDEDSSKNETDLHVGPEKDKLEEKTESELSYPIPNCVRGVPPPATYQLES
ncbi:hypothetical protein ScPMuIL_011519 [Solemya velum]